MQATKIFDAIGLRQPGDSSDNQWHFMASNSSPTSRCVVDSASSTILADPARCRCAILHRWSEIGCSDSILALVVREARFWL